MSTATALAANVWATSAGYASVAAAIAMAKQVADAAEGSIMAARAAQSAAETPKERQTADAVLRDAMALLHVALAAENALAVQLAEAEQDRDLALAGLWQDAAPVSADGRT